MTRLGPHLAVFLREHLPRDRGASPHTCEAYATCFQLLVIFAANRLRTRPSELTVEEIDVTLILAFLEHLETERGNGARSRNARLAAINAFFRFLEYRLPDCLDQAGRIHAIPVKKVDEALVTHLTRVEVKALLDAPDPRTSSGTRDRAMLHLAFSAGLRVSELIGLRSDQVDQRDWGRIHVMGKGRRERVLPLWKETAGAIRAWIAIRPKAPAPELFLNGVGAPMTRSGFEYILRKHVARAASAQPSLCDRRITPHVLRHTCAMHTLAATHDIRKVSLWLGHATLQSTEIYLRADPTEKLEALAAMEPPTLRPGRFRTPDKVLAMLNDVRNRKKYAE
ncbi:MAG: tyrosine-type recombinase/integrase [Cypionkella sp.]|jgi:site-specific recombinase XerD